jgi:AcrR family transcriptional regulator
MATDATQGRSEPDSRTGPEPEGRQGSESGVERVSSESLPEPPWRTSGRPHAVPRAPLTREAIVDAALRVLDREGLEALSMRRVGEELGTGAASLYWHVRNKEELLQLVFERAIEEVTLPDPDPSRWQEQLKDLARQMRALMNRHRDIARISLGRVPMGSAVALLTEWLFQLLRPVGIPDRVIAYIGDLAGLYVGAFAYEESLPFPSPTGEDLPPDQILAMFKDYMRSLPEDRFPHTRAAVDLIFNLDVDDRFEFGIDLILRGLATFAASDR